MAALLLARAAVESSGEMASNRYRVDYDRSDAYDDEGEEESRPSSAPAGGETLLQKLRRVGSPRTSEASSSRPASAAEGSQPAESRPASAAAASDVVIDDIGVEAAGDDDDGGASDDSEHGELLDDALRALTALEAAGRAGDDAFGPCANFALCGERAEADGGLCKSCAFQWGEALDVVGDDVDDDDCAQCPVCFERPARVKLPGCLHRFCAPDFLKIHGLTRREEGYFGFGYDGDARRFVDRGCPVCRAGRVAPSWIHTGRANCACHRCVNVCAACGEACYVACASCRVNWYCDAACQRRDWQSHKTACGDLRKADKARRDVLRDATRENRVVEVDHAKGANAWAIVDYLRPVPGVHDGLFSVESADRRGAATRNVAATLVMDVLAEEAAPPPPPLPPPPPAP